MPDLEAYTLAEAARKLGVSRQRIYQLVSAGDLGTITYPGGRRYVAGRSLRLYAAAHPADQRPTGKRTEERSTAA